MPGKPTRLGAPEIGAAPAADLSGRRHGRVGPACGHRDDAQGREGWKGHGNMSPEERKGNPKRTVAEPVLSLGPRAPGSVRGAADAPEHLGREGSEGGRAAAGRTALGRARGLGRGPRASPSRARGPRAGMRGAGTPRRVGGWVARERAAEGGSSRRVTAGESG